MKIISDASSDSARADDGPCQFRRLDLAADAITAGQARTEFDLWLQLHYVLSAIRRSDVLLAMNEAIANAAEHAYFGVPDSGTVDVEARYDTVGHILTLSIIDRGRWLGPGLGPQREPSPNRVRGRGIQLMRALADSTSIDSTPGGTHVTLTWDQLLLIGA